MCSGSGAGSYLRRIDLVYHSTLGLRVIKGLGQALQVRKGLEQALQEEDLREGAGAGDGDGAFAHAPVDRHLTKCVDQLLYKIDQLLYKLSCVCRGGE